MKSRKPIFILSFLMAAGIYGGLYAAAPHIMLLRANQRVDGISRTFKVDLRREPVEVPFQSPLESPGDLSTRPGTIRELLEKETEALPPLPMEEDIVPAEIPELAQRTTENDITREHDLERNLDVFQGIDAQILEISETTARDSVEVARRLVEPGSTRILERGELPTMRGLESGVPYEVPLETGGAGGDAVREGSGGEEPSGTVDEADPFSLIEAMDEEPWDADGPVALEPGGVGEFPDIPEEMVVARELVRQEIQETSSFESMDDLVGLDVATYVDAATGQGFFRVNIRPGQGKEIVTLPKDITFVVDASNSINQRKLTLTARGVVSSLQYLRPEDRFNIVVFRDSPMLFRDEHQHPTEEVVESARDFLADLQSKGSTDLYSAIRPVIAETPRAGIPGIVIVISDGRPTGGNLAGRDLINALSDENIHGNSIYTFGGGKTVNTYLLDLLAYRNKGMSYTTTRIEDIDDDLPRFIGQLRDAFLVNLRGDFGRIDEENIYPRQLPDFFHGREVAVYGKYDPERDKHMVLRLRGEAGSEQKDMILRAPLSSFSTGGREVAREWAFEKTYHLIGEISRLGETPELMDALQRLSREYNISTVYQPR